MSEELKPCPFCGGEARMSSGTHAIGRKTYRTAKCTCSECGVTRSAVLDVCASLDEAESNAADAWNRRAERTWHDFSDELPPVGASVLCRGRNGALYVGKPVTFKGNGTRKVWVPRGDQYRTPDKWMEIEDAD